MQKIRWFLGCALGVGRPFMVSLAPVAALGMLGAALVGCGGDDHEESLPTVQVGMTKDVQPIYDDGEMKIFEVKKGVAFPILQPDPNTERELNEAPKAQKEPYGRRPWITTDDVQVQVSWTITNLDDEDHVVELLVDPWSEFGRYFPGLQLTDADNQEYTPNFSGIDKRYIVAKKSDGESSRAHGTFAYSDLNEVAIDFATVMQLLKTPPMLEGADDDVEDATVTYTNHAFQWQNRSFKDALIQPWIPRVIAGLTGLDLGFRTDEPATVALEVEVEVLDKRGNRVRREGDEDRTLMRPTDQIITVGVAP